jgi:hypothetical protein
MLGSIAEASKISEASRWFGRYPKIARSENAGERRKLTIPRS